MMYYQRRVARGSIPVVIVVTPNLMRTTTSHSTGSFYVEMTVLAATNMALVGVGVDNGAESVNAAGGKAGGIIWLGNGNINYNGTLGAYSAELFTSGDVLGIAVNLTSGLIWFRRNNGNWNNNPSANPASGTGGFSIAAITTTVFALAQIASSGDAIDGNFAGPFINAAPSGFAIW